MLSVIDVAISFPLREERIEDAAVQLALTSTELRMFKRFYGFERFPVDDAQSLFALIDAAMTSLSSRHSHLRRKLQILTHCHTIPSISPFPEDALRLLRHRHLNYATEVMSVTMNHCATGISMFPLMDSVLSSDGMGVILIGEKAFHRTIRLIENITIMGEAATAVLVGRGMGILEYLGGHTSHDGGFSVITGHPLDGPAIGFGTFYFDFMVKHIEAALSKHGIDIGEVRAVFPHNVNIPSWRQIAKQLGIAPETIYMQNISRHGHCFGADPFINVLDALKEGRLTVGDTVLLISAGLGATVSTAVMRVTSSRVEALGGTALGLSAAGL